MYEPQDCDILQFRRWRGLLNHVAIVFIIDGEVWIYEAFPPKCHRVLWEDYCVGRVRKFVFTKANMTVLRNDSIKGHQRYLMLASCDGLEGTPYNWLWNYWSGSERLVHCVEYIAIGQIDAFGQHVYGDINTSRITPGLFEEVTLGLGWRKLDQPTGAPLWLPASAKTGPSTPPPPPSCLYRGGCEPPGSARSCRSLQPAFG